jgi:predicted CXXCH cytochrome family protein
MLRRRFWILTFVGLGSLGLLLALAGQFALPVTAAPLTQATPQPGTPQLSISNDVCLSCHGAPGQTMTLSNGDTLGLYVPADEYRLSIHGKKKYACVQCHTTVGNYPHPAFVAQDLRDVTLQLNETCKRCHVKQYDLTQDSVHQRALSDGDRQAAVCTDCHSAHAVRQLTDPQTHMLLSNARLWVPETCSKCHNAIYAEYKASVHGAALIDEGNTDVPTCIDCHGVHNISNPTTNAFRLNSPQLCAKCHTDSKRMAKYGLSTEVLNTYVADFHGTTVTIFEKQSPDAETNKPVCYDCHGVHDIAKTNDPIKGLQVRQNLLARCKVCHPEATENFPDAWLSHYIPSPEKTPMVYYVNLFYQFFIPGTLGGMAILVIMDFSRKMINRSRKKPAGQPAEPLVTPESTAPEPESLGKADTDLMPATSPEAEPPVPAEPQPGMPTPSEALDVVTFPTQSPVDDTALEAKGAPVTNEAPAASPAQPTAEEADHE